LASSKPWVLNCWSCSLASFKPIASQALSHRPLTSLQPSAIGHQQPAAISESSSDAKRQR
jgi:hypothetical protein